MQACQERGDDYTGQGLPGIWHLDPCEDEFKLRIRRRGEIYLDVTRVQYPLAPWMAGTYNNQQGKTARNMGHTIDFSKPDYFTADEYIQHVYMILGRATRLQWSLFRNLPMLPDGSDDVADAATFAVDAALQSLPDFPEPEHLPKPIGKNDDGSFMYEKNAWQEAVAKSKSKLVGGVKRKWPGRSETDRGDFCAKLNLRLASLSRVTADYLLLSHRLRGFAADAGGGGDCLFLSVAASLASLREQVHELPGPLESLFSAGVSRKQIAKQLRDIVGQAV
eukprot:s119_g9.t1